MNLLKNINVVRKKLMMGLTKNIGNSNPKIHSINRAEIKRILICRPNHRLGNQLLITPFVQEISETFPDCKIDLFVKGNLAPILFKNYENVDKIIRLPKKHFKHLFQYIRGWSYIRKKHYDIVINITKNSSSGRLSTKFANSKFKFFGDDNPEAELKSKYPDYEHIAKNPIYNFRNYLSNFGITDNSNGIPSLDIKLNIAEKALGKKLLQNLIQKEAKTICLFTFATGAKCYSESWWSEFYERLKKEYPNFNFIEVLPAENVSQIAFKEPTFYSMDIREIGSVIANTAIFIGADSGIMHLASSVKTPTVGLFSVTDPEVYAPYNNNSLGIDTNQMNIDEMIKAIDKILLAG